MNKEKLTEFYKKYNIEVNCVGIALVFAILVLIAGFLRTIFILLCVGLGLFIGKKMRTDKDFIPNIVESITKIFKK